MKRIPIPFIMFANLYLLTGCISNPKADFQRITDIQATSVKIVHSTSEDQLLTLIEQAMMRGGWKVIANHRLTTFLPTGSPVSVQVVDTVFTIPQTGLVTQELFREKESDCILRYNYYGMWKDRIGTFNASLIQTSTGEVISTFDFRQKVGAGSKSVKSVLDEMVKSFTGHLDKGQ